MYKHDTLKCFLSIYFYLIFFLVHIISILLLRYDKGHRLGTFYTYRMYIKVWVKKVCLPKAVTLAGGICEPLHTCSSFALKLHPDLSLQILVSKP